MTDKIKIKRGLKANLPFLDVGELAYCTDTKEMYIGTLAGNQLINVSSGGSGGSTNNSNNTLPSTNVIVFDSITVSNFYISRDIVQLGTVTLG